MDGACAVRRDKEGTIKPTPQKILCLIFGVFGVIKRAGPFSFVGTESFEGPHLEPDEGWARAAASMGFVINKR
jgi:hypothetical protein